MNRLPRTSLGVVGIGLIWGVLWVVLAMIVGTVIGVVDPVDIGPGEAPIELAPMIGLAGFLCGVVFASLLPLVERRTALFELPLMRAAGWGVLVAAVLPLVTGHGLPEMLVTGPVGAISAVVAVALVQWWVGGHSGPRSFEY